MPFTRLPDGFDDWGGRFKVCTGNFAFTNSYPTGGYSLPITVFGFRTQLWNVILGDAGVPACGAYRFFYDVVAHKLMVFEVAGGTPSGTIVSTFTGETYTPAGTNSAPALTMDSYTPAGTNANDGPPETFTGTPAVLTGSVAAPAFTGTAHQLAGTVSSTFTGAAQSAGAFTEVGNGTNLSTLTALRITALGR